MFNMDLRNAAKENSIKLWQIASELHVNDGNLSRKLRKELSIAEKQKIFDIIRKLSVTKV